MSVRMKRTTILSLCIAALTVLYISYNFSTLSVGSGPYPFETLHGETVMISGKGLYGNNSVAMAIQGLAHDVVTIFWALPLLLLSLYFTIKGKLWAQIMLSGVLGYFFFTFLLFLVLPAFNRMYIIWVTITLCSFFALLNCLLDFDYSKIKGRFSERFPNRAIGIFLIVNAAAIALLWLTIIAPPLFTGEIPPGIEHYTTFPVQGLDLALALPLAFVSGIYLLKKIPAGYIWASSYIFFLSCLMPALLAKIIGMGLNGVPVGPPLVIIPIFTLGAQISGARIIKELGKE